MLPEDAGAEPSGPCGAPQRAGSMEQLPALSPVLCIVLLIPTWTAAVAEIPVACKRALNPNVGASGQKPAGLRVSQEPISLHATAGENVTLSCTFQSRYGSRAKVLWFRGSGEDVVLDENHPFYQDRLHVSRLDEISKGKAMLALSKLDKRDSGLYKCCIEIHNEMTGMGGGTDLRVMQRNQSVTEDRKESKQDTSTELTIYRATIALAGVSIIILVTALLLRRRTAASPDTQQQQPAKGHSRAGGNASKDLHYAEITFKAPAHTEYASVRTQRL